MNAWAVGGMGKFVKLDGMKSISNTKNSTSSTDFVVKKCLQMCDITNNQFHFIHFVDRKSNITVLCSQRYKFSICIEFESKEMGKKRKIPKIDLWWVAVQFIIPFQLQ